MTASAKLMACFAAIAIPSLLGAFSGSMAQHHKPQEKALDTKITEASPGSQAITGQSPWNATHENRPEPAGTYEMAVPQAAAVNEPVRELSDETGRRVNVPHTVHRIISLAPNLTEILYRIGVEDRLVATSNYSDDPPAARAKPRIGDPVTPSIEQIAVLRPDLVLATTAINRLETVQSLEKLGIAVYATNPHSVEGIVQSIEHIAALVDAGTPGETLVAALRQRLAELKQRLARHPRKRVLFVVWPSPLVTVGPHTFVADALRWAGAESVVEASQDWPRISLEAVVRLNPEYLIVTTSRSENSGHAAADLQNRRGWRDVPAVREGRITMVDDAINRPGPSLLDAVEQLARQLHPEAFQNSAARKSKFEIRKAGASGTRWRFSNFEFRFPNFVFPGATNKEYLE